ncbi:tetratricopeptide repeat protein [Segatella oulorum]|uniref:tetratricopeptide repeat protein n=1 Tax=Segatella oulorum TaxID=28136 RepID=UPI00360FBA59
MSSNPLDLSDEATLQQALSQYENALKMGETVYIDSTLLWDIAQHYQYDEGDDKAAEEAVDYALRLFPNDDDFLNYKIELLLEKVDEEKYFLNEPNLNQQYLAEAKELVARITEQDTEDYVLTLARILLKKTTDSIWKHDENEAADERLWQHIANHNIDLSDDAYMEIAEGFDRLLLPKRADEWLSRCKDKENSDYLDLLATIKWNRLRYADAAKAHEKLVEQQPYSAFDWAYLAETQYKTKQYKESFESCEFALAIAPDLSTAWYTKGKCYLKRHRPYEAIDCFNHMFKDKNYHIDYKMMSGMGSAFLMLENYEGAVEMFEHAEEDGLPYNDEYERVMKDKATALFHLDRSNEAIECLEALEESQTYDPMETTFEAVDIALEHFEYIWSINTLMGIYQEGYDDEAILDRLFDMMDRFFSEGNDEAGSEIVLYLFSDSDALQRPTFEAYKALFYRFHNNPYDSYFCMCRVVESGDRDAIDVLVYNIEPVPLGADPGKYYVNLKYLLDKYGYSVDYYEDENENEET